MFSKQAGYWWFIFSFLSVKLGHTHNVQALPEATCPVPFPLSSLSLPPNTCLIHANPVKDHEFSSSPQQHGWIRGDACQTLGPAEFCTFTHPSFNDGLGLSLITTTARLEALFLSSPALTPAAQPSTKKIPWGGSAGATAGPSFHAADIPGKGVGLVADRRITAGELVLARTPAVLVDEQGFAGLGEAPLRRLLGQAVAALPRGHRRQYLDLSTGHDDDDDDVEPGVGGDDEEEEKVYQVFAKNNFRTRITDDADFHATFVDVSRLNHACRPNCGYHFDTATLSQKVYAARDILPGEELTVSYIDPIQPRDTRQAQLQSSWGFTCTCSLCSAPDDETAASDQRTAQIHGLWQTLDDYGDAADGATPEEAEALVALYEAEGLETRVHEAHYRAAVEWNGVGDARNAVRYAMLSILRGQIMKGPERPFLSSMRELVKNPEEHWTWKFRLRESKSEKDL